MAAMADADVGASTLFSLTDDTREMVDEVSKTSSISSKGHPNKRAVVEQTA